jgi:type IV secretory pathway VirB9-like protein
MQLGPRRGSVIFVLLTLGCSHEPKPLPQSPRYFVQAPAAPPRRSGPQTGIRIEPPPLPPPPAIAQRTFTVSAKPSVAPPVDLPPVATCLSDETFARKTKGRPRVDLEEARLANEAACAEIGAHLEEVNRKAAQNSAKTKVFNVVHQHRFVPGGVWEIYATPLQNTVVWLEPGEKLLGEPVTGDSERWTLQPIDYGQPGGPSRYQILVRPNELNVSTSLTIVTDRRVYYCYLMSMPPSQFMWAVSWSYPDSETATIAASLASTRAAAEETSKPAARRSGLLLDMRTAFRGYEIRVLQGRPTWLPQEVVADLSRGKTYIRFPLNVSQASAPGLWLVADNKLSLRTYRPEGSCTTQPPPCELIYALDTIVDVAELHLGNDRVRITRTR